MSDDTTAQPSGADTGMGGDLASLRKLEPLQAMSDWGFARLISRCFVHRVPANTILVEQDQVPDSAHIVLSGAVEALARHR